MDAMQILVIILSIFLALFLLLAIILMVLLIKVTRQIKDVTTTAQSAVEKINSIATGVAKVTTPSLVADLIFKHVKKFRK